jgi:hypothetical protein
MVALEDLGTMPRPVLREDGIQHKSSGNLQESRQDTSQKIEVNCIEYIYLELPAP